jgi:uridylate kinase|tara:strand:- start:783 stop:1499 length:717 start_codon:yes stop_codon:yes gene_type:complete
MPSTPKYRRILLKLSGEALMGEESFGIDPNILDRMAEEVAELVRIGVEVGIVVGGGNLFRGQKLAAAGMNRVAGDHMGMLATVMNALAIQDAFDRIQIKAEVMSAISLTGVCKDYDHRAAQRFLRQGHVVIFSAGTGNPFFTTDSAASLRAIEIDADLLLKATKVDGIYTADPAKDSSAVRYDRLTYKEVLDKELAIMDLAAFTLCRDHQMSIRVFNMNKPGALQAIICGADEGTSVE